MGVDNNELFSSELLTELGANNQFFDNLVDMIPAKLYVVGNTGDDAYNPKYRKGQHKESKEARRARNKQAKLTKYDPNLTESTLQTKQRLDQEAYADSSDDDEDDNEEDAQFVPPVDAHEEEDSEEMEDDSPPPRHTLPSSKEPEWNINTEGLSRIEILRAKLHAKIAQKQAQSKRGGIQNHKSQSISKRAARKAEKQRLKQLAIAEKNAKKYKKGTDHKTVRVEIKSHTTTHKSPSHHPPKTTTLKEDLAGINFGSIAGLTHAEYYKDNKSLKPKKKKSLDRLLQEAQEKQKRLQELKAGDEKDKQTAKRILWGDTLKEASGESSKNDPSKIKKAMKRKMNAKKKSAVAWKGRIEKTNQSKIERQTIRQHNLKQRKVGGAAGANLSKKRISEDAEAGETKRRRMGPHSEKSRAGFEGKKQGFINEKDNKRSVVAK